MSEKMYEKYAWIILFAIGVVALLSALPVILIGAPIDDQGVKNLTGMTWDEIVANSPGAASLVVYFVRLFGLASLTYAMFSFPNPHTSDREQTK